MTTPSLTEIQRLLHALIRNVNTPDDMLDLAALFGAAFSAALAMAALAHGGEPKVEEVVACVRHQAKRDFRHYAMQALEQHNGPAH